uniref:G domain-containing protein n=1 Tax=Homalodisca liturata TaxID=320908 RepID=A0A1B6HVK5_9HEMI
MLCLILQNFHRNNLFKNCNGLNLTKQSNCFSILGTVLQLERSKPSQSQSEEKNIIEKVIYNSKIKHGRPIKIKQDDAINSQLKNRKPPVIALKYFTNEYDVSSKENISLVSGNNNENINLPYERYHQVKFDSNHDNLLDNIEEEDLLKYQNKHLPFDNLRDNLCTRPKKSWMKDYDKYAEIAVKKIKEENEDEIDASWKLNYGSADPNVPSSSVPCGGCGAHLHCQDSAIPGYLPREIFVGLTETQLQALVCQRCHFLREYNTALSVSVDPEIYPQLLSKIRHQRALVILVVDMTDFPCSIWPGITDILGPKRPLIVVGNKIDLLQDFKIKWLEKAKEALLKQLPQRANILHTALVSAKTGYGIEQLITALYKLWEYRGDVYLVGCTNVGKSTLFNALLQSDYCKTKAVDLIQRATTAPWPGTTLNLLKFPIMRPEGWRVAERTARLRRENAAELRHIQQGKPQPTPQMISHVNRTFDHGLVDKYTDEEWEDPFALPKLRTLKKLRSPGSGVDPADPMFTQSKWLYDTPGVITPDQIINLLTTEELMMTIPQEPIVPRTFQVWEGQSLMVGGLGRLDYLSGPANIKMTVLAASSLPVTICWVGDCDQVYQHYLGSEVLAVPFGGPHRLKRWPGLQAGQTFVLKGTGWKESCADVVLSSAGWIAVTAQQDSMNQLQAWTPNARGIHVRIPPVLPTAIRLKGVRLYDSQAYSLYNSYVKKQGWNS